MAWTEEQERLAQQLFGPRHGRTKGAKNKHISWGAIDVPVAVLEDRDRAHGAQPTISQQLMGDPLPGRSALDRRTP